MKLKDLVLVMKSLSLFDSAIFCILKNVQLRVIGVIVGDNFPCLTAEIALFLRFKLCSNSSISSVKNEAVPLVQEGQLASNKVILYIIWISFLRSSAKHFGTAFIIFYYVPI